MQLFKNTASQTIQLFVFDTTTALGRTGDAANITFYVSKDGGATTACNDATPTEKDATNARGVYQIDLTQAETDANYLVFTGKSATANTAVRVEQVSTRPDLSTVVASLATIDARLDTEIPAIKAKTDLIPSDPADASDIAALLDALPTATENADALLDRADAIETGLTLRKLGKLIGAVLGGKVTGGATSTIVFKAAVEGSTTRATVTADADGNRSAITYNL